MDFLFKIIVIIINLLFIFNITYSQNSTTYFPILKNQNSISTPLIPYGKILKIRTNSDYIIRLSTSGRLDVWQINNNSLEISLSALSGVFSNQSTQIVDFSLCPDTNDKIGILFRKNFYIYSILNNQLQLNFNYPYIFNNYFWKQVYITNNHISFVINDGNFQRFNRTNMMLKNKFHLGFTYNNFLGDYCQNSINGEIYNFYSQFNRIRSFQCFDQTIDSCRLIFQIYYYSIVARYQINRVLMNNDCSVIYSQADTFFYPQIKNIQLNKSDKYPFIGAIKSISKLDDSNKYTMFILNNGSILIFKNSTIISNRQNLGFNLSNVIKLDIFLKNVFLGLDSEIKIMKFQCGPLKYMFKTNLCASCDQSCANCSNIDGQCYQCINQNYTLLNGACQWNSQEPIPYNDNQSFFNDPQQQTFTVDPATAQRHFYQNTALIQMITDSFSGINDSLSTVMIMLTSNPFGFLCLGFINFWSMISFYALLNIRYPFYMKELLNLIYSAINKSVFSILGDDFSLNEIILGADYQEKSQQKFHEYYTENYGLSSNFLIYNLEQLFVLLFCFLILLTMYLSKKYLLSKRSWIYKKLCSNYLYLALQQFSTGLASFSIGAFVIVSNNNQNNFNQKINLILTNLLIFFSICLPFVQISSIYYEKKEKKKRNNLLNLIQKTTNQNNNKTIQQKNQTNEIQFAQKDKKIKNLKNSQNEDLSQQQIIELIYLAECNIILPISVILTFCFQGFEIFFFISNFLLYIFGIYGAFLRKQYKINQIILNSYFLFFHFGFFMMWIFSQKITLKDQYQKQYMIYFFSMFSLVFLTLGALHQILFILFEALYFFYKIFIKKYRIKNRIANQHQSIKNVFEKEKPIVESIPNISDQQYNHNTITKQCFSLKSNNQCLFKKQQKIDEHIENNQIFQNKIQQIQQIYRNPLQIFKPTIQQIEKQIQQANITFQKVRRNSSSLKQNKNKLKNKLKNNKNKKQLQKSSQFFLTSGITNFLNEKRKLLIKQMGNILKQQLKLKKTKQLQYNQKI